MNTMFLNQRWLSCGLILLLLALPAPRLPRLYTTTLGGTLLCVFVIVTIKQLKEWEAEQLDGLLDAIALVNRGERVIDLNLYDGSAYVRGRQGLHLFAYAQVLRGAEPHFTFTEHYSGIVQFRTPPPPNPNGTWSGFQRTPAQLRAFDKILVHGDDTLHAYAQQRWSLVPLDQTRASWRVYRSSP